MRSRGTTPAAFDFSIRSPERDDATGKGAPIRWMIDFEPHPQPPAVDQSDAPRASSVGDRHLARTFGTIQTCFYNLLQSDALLEQTHWRLANRGLLIPDGGLCATTSAVHVLHAAFAHLGRDTSIFTSGSDDLIARLISSAWEELQQDARMGLDFSSLSTVIEYVANQIHPDVGVKTERPSFRTADNSVDLHVLKGDDNTLSLLGVTIGKSAHAITLLDIDPYRNIITYSDPNHPRRALEASYSIRGGKLLLHSFAPGEIIDVLKISAKHVDASEKPVGKKKMRKLI